MGKAAATVIREIRTDEAEAAAIRAEASETVNGKTYLALPDLQAICRAAPGKHKRIPTYCDALDALTGGGLQTARVVAFGGEPGGNKTGVTTFISYEMARRGTGTHPIHVHYIACDEPRDGVLSRIGQLMGVTRPSLDDEDTSISRPAWEYVAAGLVDIPGLTIWDPREDLACIEQIVAVAAARARSCGARLVVVIDSIQRARFACDAMADGREKSARETMEGRVDEIRRISILEEACVIFISELNRASYRHGAEADLGSFKESSGIEYTADLAITFRCLPDGVIEATPHKNRLYNGPGDKDPFRLHRTPRCGYETVEMPSREEQASAAKASTDAELANLAETLKRTLAQSPVSITNQRMLRELLPGIGNDKRGTVIARLQAAGEIEGGSGKPFRVRRGPE